MIQGNSTVDHTRRNAAACTRAASSSEHVLRIGLTNELNQLPGLVRFIDDEGMRPGIETFAPDPAMRDVGLAALLRFAPSGRRGIHTLEIGSRSEGLVSLGPRERVVLKDAIRSRA
jgi:hypothetical protein